MESLFKTWHGSATKLSLLLLCFLVGCLKTVNPSPLPSDSKTQDLLMRGAHPEKPEAYLCTAYPVDDPTSYIYKFEAVANASTAHHILLYGCDGEPYRPEPDSVWRCPRMCKSGSPTILFAWAKNAPATELPKDLDNLRFPHGVGLRIGQQTTIKTIVLQVHYAKAFTADEQADHSGIRIYTTKEEQPYVAGIYLMLSSAFSIPPKQPEFGVDFSCDFNMKKSIFPFAYRTHAHSLGRVITGYQYNGSYHEIGKGNPQWPQAFYPVKENVEIKPGDSVAGRCTYDSTSQSQSVSVGSTGADEMCNFYVMFYTDSSVKDPYGMCNGDQKRELTGDSFPADVSVPLPPNPTLEEEASGHHHHGGMTGEQDHEPLGVATSPDDGQTQDILMRGAKPKIHDAYLCTAYPVDEQEKYIYKFEAIADGSVAHHMLLYGCDGEPFSDDPIWNCPSMCKGGAQTILFAWAKNAPSTVLPKDVGFRIGQKSTIKTLVLQVHYAKAFADDEEADNSGIKLYTTFEKQPYVAGIFLLGSGFFSVPPGKSSYPVDVSCQFNMEKSIFPFAYRTHAHSLGKVITGYQYNNSYHVIGKGNPQWPQAFYPVQDKVEVKPGDFLAARCTYDSTEMDHVVSVGSTGDDEMCNFYIMFYTDKSVDNPSGSCWGDYAPELTGNHFPADVSVPLPPNPALEEEASGHHHHGGMTGEQDHEPLGVATSPDDGQTQDILMRGAKPKIHDAYLCTAYPVDEQEKYIYKFEAMADGSVAHHMLLYGCDGEPFSDDPIWDCPSMCRGGAQTILFAWAKNAPSTVLPKDVGFRIGQKSTIKTLVLQVHYAKAFADNEEADNSGIKLYTTFEKQPYVAGIFLLGAGFFSVPPGKSSYPVDVSCQFSMEKSIFPFAYRTHAHSLGKVITGYQYNNSYHVIGKGNPQWPQAFYPVQDNVEVKPGEFLAARCTYDSTQMDHVVSVGSTGDNEMCNFYIMFYTDKSVDNPSGSCWGNNAPQLTGSNFPADVSVPLPPNPALEEEAKGHHHHHAGMGGSDDGKETDTETAKDWTMDVVMRGAKPDQPQTYLCTAYPVTHEEAYIYQFEKLTNSSVPHVISVHGCNGEPYSTEAIWNCPDICKDDEQSLIFASGPSDQGIQLPEGVGFRIGQKSSIKTLVLQVHYADAFKATDKPDYSGVKLHITQEKQPFVAGVYVLWAEQFTIPPHQPAFPVDLSCGYTEGQSIFPIAYKVHTHSLGTVVTGYHYNGTYTEIGKGNPLWPQSFYPVTKQIEVKPGDLLAARCTYDSTNVDSTVSVGPTEEDEMCNFYFLYYTNPSVRDPGGKCINDEIPILTGSRFPADVSVPPPPNPQLEAVGNQFRVLSQTQSDIHFEHSLVFNGSWPSADIQFGQIGGVATDKDGNVYVFHRGSRTWTYGSFNVNNDFMYPKDPINEDTIIILDSTGKLIRKFGAGEYFMPHGIEVDQEGNIWLTDVGLHQVFKIPAGETKPSLVLGKRFQHSEDPAYFCKPTDVAVLSSGEFYVSDGYCNGRVLKFTKEGNLIRMWGRKNTGLEITPPAGVFDIPHGITVSEENNLVCVADRENGRIQCFDLDGNFKHIIQHQQFGPRLFAVEQCPMHGGILYAVNGPSYDGLADFTVQGFTLDIKTGDMLEMWNVPQHMKNPHDVCVHPASHSVYVGELDPRAVWKFTRGPVTATSEGSQHEHEHQNPEGAFRVDNGDQKQKTTTTTVGQADVNTDGVTGSKTNDTVLAVEGKPVDESNDITPSIVIGCLLVIPVVLLLVITLLVRAHQSGKMKCWGRHSKRVFSLQGILGNSHKGFDPLSTEESDHELDPDDSDQEDYLAPKKTKSKA